MFVIFQGIPVCVFGHDCALVLLYAIDVSMGLTYVMAGNAMAAAAS